MPRKGEEARRKKGLADTRAWARVLAQAGIEHGAQVRLDIPVWNMAQLVRVGAILKDVAQLIERVQAAHRLSERSQVYAIVHRVRVANRQIARTSRGSGSR